MEKRTAHYPLETVRGLIRGGKVLPTAAALKSAFVLGIDFDGMVAIVLGLTARDFYKSMTTYADHTIGRTFITPRRRRVISL